MTKRNVITAYYTPGHKLKKYNRAMNPNRAVEVCVGRMQINYHGAMYAEVYDEETTVQYASVKRTIAGKIIITYNDTYNPRNHETRYAVTPLLED